MTNSKQRSSRKAGQIKQKHRPNNGLKQKLVTEYRKLDPVEEKKQAEQDFEATLDDWPIY